MADGKEKDNIATITRKKTTTELKLEIIEKLDRILQKVEDTAHQV